jgi:hypothetical protein
MGTWNEMHRSIMRTGVKRAFVIAACAVLAGCVPDNPLQPGGGRVAVPRGPAAVLNPACDGAGGVTHPSSFVVTPETWTRANSPHHVQGPILVMFDGRLTLEPGVVVCFAPSAGMLMDEGGSLVADGLDTAHIVLTAAQPDSGWFGLQFSQSRGAASSLKNARIEYLAPNAFAVASTDSTTVAIDSSVIRQAGAGVSLFGRGSSISRSRVDTTANVDAPAVTLGTLTRFENTTIRGAAGVGLAVYAVYGVSLLGGRIEGSGGMGLTVSTTGAGIVAARPIRVVGGASYPAGLVVSAFARLYPALSDQDSLLGNARDTLQVAGGILQAFAYPTQALPWRVTWNIIVQYYGILRAWPGASLTFNPGIGITAQYGGRVVARGTRAAPVRFTGADPSYFPYGWAGITLRDTPSLASYLTNVVIEYSNGVDAGDGHTLVIDSAVMRWIGPIRLMSPNSRISRSRLDTTLVVGTQPAVQLGSNAKIESTLIRGATGTALAVYSTSVQVVSCEIRDSWLGGGIELHAAVAVHDCNLVNNWGDGITNLTADSADVTNNWWGDTGGPMGLNGDGASGLLLYTPWRTTPFVLPYVP